MEYIIAFMVILLLLVIAIKKTDRPTSKGAVSLQSIVWNRPFVRQFPGSLLYPNSRDLSSQVYRYSFEHFVQIMQ